MTSTLLQESDAQALRDVVENMDSIEWQRFFRSLTGASSAQGILTQKRWSLLDAIQRGAELLEGTTFRRVSLDIAHSEALVAARVQPSTPEEASLGAEAPPQSHPART